ncbi:hypothetical protein D3C73_1477280 [compost metagenome]
MPNRVPIRIASKMLPMGLAKPRLIASVAMAYCTTEATAANEISMPPVTSTTNRPRAKIPLTA